MTDTFGGQAVAFVTVSRSGTRGYLGLAPESRADDTVLGCHFRPVSVAEEPEGSSNVATEIWKLTAPPEAAALAATSTGELTYDGMTFRIDGPIMPKYNFDGTVHHVTIMAKRQDG